LPFSQAVRLVHVEERVGLENMEGCAPAVVNVETENVV